MKIKLLAETQLNIDESKVLHKLIGLMSQHEIEQKGLSSDEHKTIDSMWEELDGVFGDNTD